MNIPGEAGTGILVISMILKQLTLSLTLFLLKILTDPMVLKLSKKRTNSKQYKYFYTNRIVNLWNNLPSEVVNAPSTNAFKNMIDQIFKEYMYCTNIDLYYK